MTRYLTVDEILQIHHMLIERFGGSHGVRDLGLITAAVLRPQTGYYDDTIEEASALWESLGMNHGFVDGNKRIAFAAMDLFLVFNGLRLEEESHKVVKFIYSALENGEFQKDKLDAWLRSRVQVQE